MGAMDPTRIALIGAPTDINSSFLRGPAKAPEFIRAALRSDAGNAACENGLEFGRELELLDLGDLALREEDADHGRIVDGMAAAMAQGAVPILLGGDHCVSFPAVEAVAARYGPVEILHFDAHPDTYEDFGGNPRSHASPFARILERGLARRLVQVGIRTATRHQREQAQRYGIETFAMPGFTPAAVPVLKGPLYVSVDLDGLDPAYAPGVSHPEPGGLSVRQLLEVLQAQTAPIVGADVVELNPDRDPSGITAVVAAKLVKELAAAARR